MKKIIAVAAVLLMIAASASASEYKAIAEVVHSEGYIVEVMTDTGDLWEFEADDASWTEGDLMVATFEDNNNDFIEDDELLTVQYLFNSITRQ